MVWNTRLTLKPYTICFQIHSQIHVDLRNWFWFVIGIQARCISDVKADTDHTSFITGTQSLKEENEVNFYFYFFWLIIRDLKTWLNFISMICKGSETNGTEIFQVHLIRLSTGGTELVCEGLFSHPNEIWDLASCPFDQRIFSTVYSTGNLWDFDLLVCMSICFY